MRLLQHADDVLVSVRLENLLRARVAERVGVQADAFYLALRLVACDFLGVVNYQDCVRLRELQMEDGGWPASRMYLFPQVRQEVGSRGAVTAFAVRALGIERR